MFCALKFYLIAIYSTFLGKRAILDSDKVINNIKKQSRRDISKENLLDNRKQSKVFLESLKQKKN